MARQSPSLIQRQALTAPLFWDLQGFIYNHPESVTTGNVFFADASARFIGVPPLNNTNGPTNTSRGAPGEHALYRDGPTVVYIYRDNDFWLRMDTIAESRESFRVPGGVAFPIPMNPGVRTLSVVAVTGTGPITGGFGYGS